MSVTETFVAERQGAEVVMSANLSDDGRYRYLLTRSWGRGSRMGWIMLNPSTADHERDDPTIRRCMGFARRDGHAGIVVVNLYGLRVTKPVHLFDGSISDDPNGPENRMHVENVYAQAVARGWPIVAAWGAHPRPVRSTALSWLMRQGSRHLSCVGWTASGDPRHPLYVRGDAPVEGWA